MRSSPTMISRRRSGHTCRSMPATSASRPDMRVAIVGTGPSGCYALQHLLDSPAVESISVIDRLLTPGGLVRAGVAPDHPETKKVFDGFARTLRDPRVDCYFGVEIGRDISHSDVL